MKNILSSQTNTWVKLIKQLKNEKHRRLNHAFIVEGEHLVTLAYQSQRLRLLVVSESSPFDLPNVEKIYLKDSLFTKISQQVSPQGVLGICTIEESKKISSDQILYLDNLNDPGNLGTILRTALAFNYRDIILSPQTVSPYNEKAVAASQGAIFGLNIFRSDLNILNNLKEENYTIYATSLHADSQEIPTVNFTKKHILVLGNEAHGVCQEILTLSQIKIIIPIQHFESLNVAIAGAIVMYVAHKK